MNDPKDIPGIMSPIPLNLTCPHCNLECRQTCSRARAEKEALTSHLEKMHKQNHVWKYWEHEGYELRACPMCGMLEAKGPGGWSEVP